MHEIAARDVPTSEDATEMEALELYKNSGQIFKCELVEEKATEPMVSFYTTGNSLISAAVRTSLPPAHQGIQADERLRRLLEGLGEQPANAAYLRGMFLLAGELDEYLHKIEEAKRRDHRRLAPSSISSALKTRRPGLIFWHPKGGLVRN